MQEMIRESDWSTNAKCRGVNPDFFFPEGSKKEVRARNLEAKAFCIGCPVINECLEDALANRGKGIRGGTTESERRRIIKSL